jgi:hypothetical protein
MFLQLWQPTTLTANISQCRHSCVLVGWADLPSVCKVGWPEEYGTVRYCDSYVDEGAF